MGFGIINILKKEQGLTNAQIAQMSGITLSTLDKITSGVNKNPKLDTLQAICKVLGCTLNDFMDSPPKSKEAPPYSGEALKLAQDYDGLDEHGRRTVRLVTDQEKVRIEDELKKMSTYLEATEEIIKQQNMPTLSFEDGLVKIFSSFALGLNPGQQQMLLDWLRNMTGQQQQLPPAFARQTGGGKVLKSEPPNPTQ